MSTSAVEVSIQATSPLFGVGVGAAAAGLASSFFTSAAAGLSGVAAGLPCASTAPAKATQTAMATPANNFFIAVSFKRRPLRFSRAGADDFFERHYEKL